MLIGINHKVECVDNYNITVFHQARPKKGDSKELWKVDAYFSTLAGALHYIVNQEIKGTGLKELRDIVERVEGIHAMIDITLKGIQSSALPVVLPT